MVSRFIQLKCYEIIIKSLDPLRAKKPFIGKKLGHTAKVCFLFQKQSITSYLQHILYRLLRTINPLVLNGLSNPYHLDESTFLLRSHFYFIFDDIHENKQNIPRLDATFHRKRKMKQNVQILWNNLASARAYFRTIVNKVSRQIL